MNGTGSSKKLVVTNSTKALVFKIYAPGGECDIKYLTVKFRDRDGTRYLMDGGCYPGAEWARQLGEGQEAGQLPEVQAAVQRDLERVDRQDPSRCS